MIKSELYSNLKETVELLYELLLPEGSTEVSRKNSEEELELLQNEINALDYSCLDEVYHGGLKEVINDDLSPVENALIAGVGLLDEYGLSEEEFYEWAGKQPEVYSLLLGMVITGDLPKGGKCLKMGEYFDEEYRKELFDPANINISPKNGMHFAEEKPEDGSQSFYYLQKVIVFDKAFDAYNGVARELKPILQEARKFYLDKQAELYKNLYTREIENNTENGRCMFMSHDIKCSQADYFTEPEISRLLKILSPLDKSTLEELLIDPKERAAKRAKTAAERKEFMDFWSAESLEKHLQNPDVNISALAKIECYLYKALDDRMGDISECQNYYSLYTEAERDVAQKKVNFICTWIKEHPLDFDWTDEMEEANQQVQYQIYANKMLSYLKKNASAKEQFDTAVRFAIQYDVVDENNNVVTSYEPKIKFTMSLLANLELKIIFGTVPGALECHSYEEAVEHRNQFYEIVKKYSLGEVTGNQCVLNKMYDDMFAQKGSYAFYIQWLNNEFPSEVEYQKKLQETKGLKKILVMATKPNHLATIE